MDGRNSTGSLDADKKETAVQLLFEQGLFVVEICEIESRRERTDGATYASGVGQGFFSTILGNIVPFVTLGELAMVSREFATAIGAGLRIDHAISALRMGQLSPLMRQALKDVSWHVESGYSIADGMDRHPRVFNKMYRGMVRVGEGSGSLDEILKNLADMFEEELELRRKLQGMMVYPGFVVGVLVAATFILGWIGFLPMRIFQSILLFIAVIFAFWLFNKNRHVSSFVRSFLSRLPGIGSLIRKISIARVCFALGTMIKSGVPYLQALDWARDSANLASTEAGLRRAYRSVSAGETLSDALTTAGIFPPMARNLLKVGEQAGSVDTMLFKIHEYLRQEINYQTKNLVTALGPTLLVVLAVVVGYVLITFWQNYFGIILRELGE